MVQRPNKSSDRRGTTLVETAIVLPIFLVFVFALFAFSHARLVDNMLTTACRTAARAGSTEGATTAQVTAEVRRIIAPVMNPDKATIMVKNASVYDTGGAQPSTSDDFTNMPDAETANAKTRDLLLVRATVDYNDVAVLPMPFMAGVRLSGQAFVRHE